MDSGEASRPRTPSNIAAYFGRLADTYGDGAYYGNRRSAVLDTIAPEIAKARDVLDVGCGNGAYLTKFVEAAGIHAITGIDLTFDMLLSARTRVGAKCRLINANVSRLPFKTGSFDFIFASHVLQFVADGELDGVVAGFVRCLRSGGILVATGRRGDSARAMMSAMVGPERWREYQEVIFRRAPRREDDTRPKDRFQNAFAQAGLRVEERAAPFTVDRAAIEEWMRIRWMPLVPANERERAEAMLAELATAATSESLALNESLILGQRDS